jgi:MarR family transcriptional regulator for hemolysin
MENNLCWLLSQTSHALMTEMTAAMEAVGLSPRAHHVLETALQGEKTQSEIAQAVGLDKTTMVVTIDELEHAGLAERRPSKTDRRARVIVVTKAGKQKVAQGRKVMERTQAEVLDTLPDDQREALVGGLCQLMGERLAAPAECSKRPRRPRAVA